jgi:hypothetical protein
LAVYVEPHRQAGVLMPYPGGDNNRPSQHDPKVVGSQRQLSREHQYERQ